MKPSFMAFFMSRKGAKGIFYHPFFYLSFIIYAGYSMNFMFHI